MSFDIDLIDPKTKELAIVDSHCEGGTYCESGTPSASLNITYNYSEHFREALDKEKGLRWLYGKTGKQAVDRLTQAVIKLGVDRSENYWDSTPGNAGYALFILLQWATQHPKAIFKGD